MMDEGRPRQFHERFDIDVGLDEAKRRFINRVNVQVFESMSDGSWRQHLLSRRVSLYEITRHVALYLGERTPTVYNPAVFVQDDFVRCLEVLEAVYEALRIVGLQDELSHDIEAVLSASEVDLGVDWQPPIFVRTGAPLLDERLINDSLHWLRDQEYESVLEPYEKGLRHYLEAQDRPDRLADVVTDMYEAVEALAKLVTGRDYRDLSANREMFVRSLVFCDA